MSEIREAVENYIRWLRQNAETRAPEHAPDAALAARQERLRREMNGLLDDIELAFKVAKKLPPPQAQKIQQMVHDKLVALSEREWQMLTGLRRERAQQRRDQLLRNPHWVPNKIQRITLLSDLLYGTPRWEIQAAVERMLLGKDLD